MKSLPQTLRYITTSLQPESEECAASVVPLSIGVVLRIPFLLEQKLPEHEAGLNLGRDREEIASSSSCSTYKRNVSSCHSWRASTYSDRIIVFPMCLPDSSSVNKRRCRTSPRAADLSENEYRPPDIRAPRINSLRRTIGYSCSSGRRFDDEGWHH